jgi:hypothetical protein
MAARGLEGVGGVQAPGSRGKVHAHCSRRAAYRRAPKHSQIGTDHQHKNRRITIFPNPQTISPYACASLQTFFSPLIQIQKVTKKKQKTLQVVQEALAKEKQRQQMH